MDEQKIQIVTGDIIEYIYMLSNGHTTKEIAKLYNINIRTLESKLAMVRKNFNIENSTQLVAFFLRNSLIK
jgi:DNA-binding CsgD family transcriptional regulator